MPKHRPLVLLFVLLPECVAALPNHAASLQYAETYSTVLFHVSGALDREYFRVRRNEKEAETIHSNGIALREEAIRLRSEYRRLVPGTGGAKSSEILKRLSQIRSEIAEGDQRIAEMEDENATAKGIMNHCLDAVAAGWFYTLEEPERHAVYLEAMREFHLKVTPIEMEGEVPIRLISQAFLAIRPDQETARTVSLAPLFAQEAQLVRPRWPLSLLFNAAKERTPSDRDVYAAARKSIEAASTEASMILTGLVEEWGQRDWFGRLHAIWAMNQEGYVLEVADVQHPATTTIRVEAGGTMFEGTVNLTAP